VVVFDLSSNQIKFEIPMEDQEINVVISPDGRFLLVSPSAGRRDLYLYDIVRFQKIGSISTGERYRFRSPIFEKDGNRFAVLLKDKVYIFSIR